MKNYKDITGRNKCKYSQKLLENTKVEKILLYTLLLKWYLCTAQWLPMYIRHLKYTSGRPSKWFEGQVSEARGEANECLKRGRKLPLVVYILSS